MPIKGFFPGSELAQVKAPQSLVPKCGACRLHKSDSKRKCHRPKWETVGQGKKKILIVNAFPSARVDTSGDLFGSPDHELLRNTLRRNGVDMERDCWVDHALICAPRGVITTAKHVSYCRPNLTKRIQKLKPTTVILLGREAVASVVGWLWKENVGLSAQRWTGWRIPCQRINAWLCPTFHPSVVENELKGKYKNPVPKILFEKHIAKALENPTERPWATVPDWASEVECIQDARKAARILRKMVEKGGPVAFDYEANMLKPEGKKFKILSCSVCWRGKKTIAYPWDGDAIDATKELLKSDLPKIAANLKYEDRVTYRDLGVKIRNWYFDTMLGAHAIDSRKGTKSLKFQAFVCLGMDSYNDHIEKFFESVGTMEENLIEREISISDLLKYNGLDSLLEYKLAEHQMEVIGYPKPKGMK